MRLRSGWAGVVAVAEAEVEAEVRAEMMRKDGRRGE